VSASSTPTQCFFNHNFEGVGCVLKTIEISWSFLLAAYPPGDFETIGRKKGHALNVNFKTQS
jgi:hypothetical protein